MTVPKAAISVCVIDCPTMHSEQPTPLWIP